MSIQWFPGHMHKAMRELTKLINGGIDVVVELLDARAPLSSCNPLLESLVIHKPILRILNKSDLADMEATNVWLNFFNNHDSSNASNQGQKSSNGKNVLAISRNSIANKTANNKSPKAIINLCKSMAKHRNSFDKPLRIMIIGIPNVGKSTLINQLVGKKSAKTGDIPAVTKAIQCLTIDDNVMVYDTPGMMWPKILYDSVGYNLALCNSIGRNALDEELLALYLLDYLLHHAPHMLSARYHVNLKQLQETQASFLLDMIGSKRGALLTGGRVDKQKASEIIINDFRSGKLGLITLESPEMWQDIFATHDKKIT